jgi:hypothetical protein
MKTSGLSSVLSMLAVATSFNGQIASAGEAHHRLMLPSARAQIPKTSEPLQIVGLQANFTQAYPTMGANADGSDIWPCLGRGNNTDCAIDQRQLEMPGNCRRVR